MIIKTVFKLIFLLLIGTMAYSQQNNKQIESFSPITYWGVSFVPVLVQKGHIDGDLNKYSLSSSPQLGGEILINYYYNFEPNYSLVFSAGGELLVHSLNYEIPKSLFNPLGGTSISFNPVGPIKMSSSYLKVQAELQSTLHKKQKKNWFGAIGLSFLYPIQRADEYDAGILWGSNSQSVQQYVLIQYQNYQHKQKLLLNCHIAGGHEWALPTGNMLQVALKLNYSFVDIATATYVFTVDNEPQLNGPYSISSSCIGLSVSYIFSKPKRL